jgi:SAM-dependent methyltransferase
MIYKNAEWDKIWSGKFAYGYLRDWAADIFVNIQELLKEFENPQILNAGCGRGLIDYWLINVFDYQIVLLDNSAKCIKNLRKAFGKVKKDKFKLCYASILDIPYTDNKFDLVWNSGVLEHFLKEDYKKAIKEVVRVSKKYILIVVPYAKCKPYLLTKRWLEENNLWMWGYEDPKVSLKDELESNGVEIIKEKLIGSAQTNRNYVNMVPLDRREQVLKYLNQDDFNVFPHLMTIGKKK